MTNPFEQPQSPQEHPIEFAPEQKFDVPIKISPEIKTQIQTLGELIAKSHEENAAAGERGIQELFSQIAEILAQAKFERTQKSAQSK